MGEVEERERKKASWEKREKKKKIRKKKKEKKEKDKKMGSVPCVQFPLRAFSNFSKLHFYLSCSQNYKMSLNVNFFSTLTL